MNKRISPTLIGAFVVGALALLVIAIIALGSGSLFRKTYEFVLYFQGSVNGLNVGAPVKYKGVEIGSVTDILLQLEKAEPGRIPVIIEVDAKKIAGRGFRGSLLVDPDELQRAIDQGLRGQLRMESFVTGVLYVALDQYPGSAAQFVQPPGSRYQEIPTVPTELEQVQDEVRVVFAKLAKIDFNTAVVAMTHAFEGMDRLTNSPALNNSLRSLERLMPKVDEAVVNIRRLAANLDNNASDLSSDLQQTSGVARRTLVEIEMAAKQTGNTMKEGEGTLANARAVIDPESPTFYELTKSLREISGAARSLQLLADYLERNPRALIFGKPESE
jgi:phospholipid/cholesterol/gamma-HCH transport system substrate-binding protein